MSYIKTILSVMFILIGFILFEIVIYLSVQDRIEAFEYELKSMKIELEEVQKTQRLIAQDADYALKLVVESAGGTDDKKATD